jgi:hypothetical protein
MATGLLTMVVPFLANFSAAAAVVSVVVGATVTGVSLMATPDERGFTAIPISTLHAFDWGAVVGLFGSALILAFAGDPVAALCLTGIAALQLVGNLTTRYSLRG